MKRTSILRLLSIVTSLSIICLFVLENRPAQNRILHSLNIHVHKGFDGQKHINEQLNAITIKNLLEIIRLFANEHTFHCNNAIRPSLASVVIENVNWQIQSSDNAKIFLYSSFYDDRPLAGSLPFVRVVGMATFTGNLTLFCHLWYRDLEKPLIVQAIINETGINRYGFQQNSYREYTFSCQLPFLIPLIPNYVSITFNTDCTNYTNYVPVQFHVKDFNPKIEFGVCVCNGHGFFKPEFIVEWIEYYKLMGVKEINLYNTTYEGINSVLEYYVRRGEVILSQLRHPLGKEKNDRGRIRNLRITALNDCMMKNMYRYRYLVVVDHDELIVPRGNLTDFQQLIQQSKKVLNKKDEIASFSFYNAYFFLTFPQDLYQPWYMKSLRFRFRAKPNSEYVGSKSILSPLHCFNLMNHYCYVSLPLYKGVVTHFVPTVLGLSHHYRFCQKFYGTKSCEGLHLEKTADDDVLKFAHNLTRNVEHHLKQLHLL